MSKSYTSKATSRPKPSGMSLGLYLPPHCLKRIFLTMVMFKTFNMGWGFGIIVDKSDVDTALNVLESSGVNPQRIGKVTNKERTVEIEYKQKHMILT